MAPIERASANGGVIVQPVDADAPEITARYEAPKKSLDASGGGVFRKLISSGDA